MLPGLARGASAPWASYGSVCRVTRLTAWGSADLLRRLLSSLVLVEGTADGRVASGTLSTVTAAQQLNAPVTAFVSGSGDKAKAVAEYAARVEGVKEVVVADHPGLERGLPEPLSLAIQQLQKQRSFTHILSSASSHGKNVLPRAAALLGVQPVSDVLEVSGPDTFRRPIYAGNAIATVQYNQPGLRMLTVRSTSFAPAAVGASTAAAITPADPAVLEAAASAAAYMPKWLRLEGQQSSRPELGTAKVVVCGGRALKSAENFKMLERLADLLGGAVGASRAAVDAGYAANDLQVGQTGKVVAPQLYIGIGISGAIQHLAGMKDSKTIVAINSDPEAPMYQVSDYYLVQDLFEAIPALIQELEKEKGNK